MTKEDFDAEVYEYAKSRIGTEDSRMTDRMLAYRAGAESREKQIQIDAKQIRALQKDKGELIDRVKELEELIEKYRQAVDKCLHITFMGGGCEVNTIGQYATLVDGYLTDVEGLAKWKK